MKTKTTKVRIQPLEWFEKNCYFDKEGDYWEDQRTAELYFKLRDASIELTDAELQAEKYFYCGDVTFDGAHGNVVDAEDSDFRSWEWAVQEYITEETHPEYYL